MKQQIIFDEAVTDADRDNVGAYIRAAGGTQITATGTALDVNIASSDIQVDVDVVHTEDSVALGDGTTLYTGTTYGSDHGLDVNVIRDPRIADTDFATTQTSVTDTSGSLVGSALANRKRLLIHNLGAKRMYIGKTTATTAGFPISPGATLDLAAGPALDIVAVTDAGTADARMLELS